MPYDEPAVVSFRIEINSEAKRRIVASAESAVCGEDKLRLPITTGPSSSHLRAGCEFPRL